MRVRRALTGAPLPCGCLSGLYEAWNGAIVQILDARGDRCRDASHQIDARLDRSGEIFPPRLVTAGNKCARVVVNINTTADASRVELVGRGTPAPKVTGTSDREWREHDAYT